jgi:hypothetical protein
MAQMKRSSSNLLVACAAGLAFAYAISLGFLCATHAWLIDAHGRPQVIDFLALWSAGGLARDGAAVAAYDVHVHHAAEVAAIGHEFRGGLGWLYPPFFLFAAALLAWFGYAQAFALWIALTLAGYAATAAAIARRGTAALFALVAPWTLANVTAGQTGFLTASLLGVVLLLLESQPALSGILLGLLSYKPQFGLLFPFALMIGGHWRAFGWAAATALCLIAVSIGMFGTQAWLAFFQTLPAIADQVLVRGGVGWNKMQSLYGLARWLGLSDRAGWALQISLMIACLASIGLLWRSRAGQALKAAGLSAAALLATPYLFVYDLPVLAVAIAFLYRDRAFDRLERAGVGFAVLTVCVFVVTPTPCGLFGVLAIAALVARRALAFSVSTASASGRSLATGRPN